MARQAKVVISSVNQVGPGLKAAAKDLVSFESNVVRVGNALKTALSVGAVTAFAAKVVQFGTESVKAFGEVERKMIQLKTALGGNETSFERMTGLIADLSRQTLRSKGDIQDLVADLAALGKSDADIERIATAAVNLSNVTGQGLNEAMKQVNNTFAGSTDELGKLIPEIKGLTKEQLAAGDAADIINTKLGALSEQMSKGISQSMKNLSDSWGDFTEEIGALLAPALNDAIRMLIETLDKMGRAIRKFRGESSAEDMLIDLYEKIAQRQAAMKLAEAELQRLTARGIRGVAVQNIQDEIAQLQIEIRGFEQQITGLFRSGKVGVKPDTPRVTPSTTGGSGGGSGNSPGTSAPPVEQINAIADAWARMGNHIDYALEGAVNVANVATPFQQAWGNALEGMAEQFTSWSDLMYNTISDVMNAVGGVLRDALMAIGEMLVTGQMDWKNLKVAALQAISQILQALAAQLFALSAIKLMSFQFGQAALAAAAGAAALVAAGAVGAWAANLSSDGGGSSTSPSTSTGGGSGAGASYTGSQPITFNFYNQGNVVGSGGLEELAMLIDSIIKRNARYA